MSYVAACNLTFTTRRLTLGHDSMVHSSTARWRELGGR